LHTSLADNHLMAITAHNHLHASLTENHCTPYDLMAITVCNHLHTSLNVITACHILADSYCMHHLLAITARCITCMHHLLAINTALEVVTFVKQVMNNLDNSITSTTKILVTLLATVSHSPALHYIRR